MPGIEQMGRDEIRETITEHCRNTIRRHIRAFLYGINCRTMDYGAGLTALSLHLGAWSGLALGNK